MERGEMRLALPEYEGKATNNLEYMIESIFLPEAYVVPGEWPDEMSPVYRLIMSDQDLADILAWIATLDRPTSTTVPTPISEPTAALELSATPLPEVDLNMVLPEGNPRKGFGAAVRFGCQGCHANDEYPLAGPRFTAADGFPGILERGELRIADPKYGGNASSNLEFFIESVFLPEAYLVPGEWEEPMSLLYFHTLKEQELADILAWIATLEE
jgi:hypothetical protein